MSTTSDRLLRLMLDAVDKHQLPMSVRQVEVLARDVARDFEPRTQMPAVTQQQREVWMGIVAGESISQTARRMCISIHSVKTYRSALYRRLDVASAAEAAAYAYRCGLVSDRSPVSAGVAR